MKMQSDKINEAVSNNDLKNLVDATVSIDQYKSKVGNDSEIIVLAIKVKDQDPASDLSQFLETGHKSLDVDISPGPDDQGKYTVFVELERDSNVYDKIEKMLEDIKRVDEEIKEWMFVSYEHKKPQPFTKETFNSSVIVSQAEYDIKHNKEAKDISERLKFLNSY